MATLLKSRARAHLAEAELVCAGLSYEGGKQSYRLDLYQRHPLHDFAVVMTREEMLSVVSSWIACEARLEAEAVKKAAKAASAGSKE